MPSVEPAGTALFLKRWLRRPFATGAVVPSGRLLATTMARATRAAIEGWPGHVVDDVVPLACGGADDPSNMQWQTTEEGKAKDKVERKGCSSSRSH